MSSPDCVEIEYEFADQVRGLWWCENIGGNCSEIFRIDQSGKLVDGDLGFTGHLKIYRTSPGGATVFYLVHLENGRFRSYERTNLITFETGNPVFPATEYFCEQLEPNDGTIYQITKEGRLRKSGAEDLNFDGDLIFYPATNGGGRNDRYIARFDRGQIQSLETIDEKTRIGKTLRIFV